MNLCEKLWIQALEESAQEALAEAVKNPQTAIVDREYARDCLDLAAKVRYALLTIEPVLKVKK